MADVNASIGMMLADAMTQIPGMTFIMSITKVVSVVVLIYLVIIIIKAIFEMIQTSRIKKIAKDVEEINKKLDFLTGGRKVSS